MHTWKSVSLEWQQDNEKEGDRVNAIQIFKNKEFGELRIVMIDNEPWIIGKDVAEALGYANPRKAIADHVDEEDKGVTKCDTLGGKQDSVVINESGLYALIFGSKLESAKRFKRWVTSEVLPSLRKNGGYILNQDGMTQEQILAAGLQVAKRIIEDRDKQIEDMKSKEQFANAIMASKDSILVGDLAKLISQNGVQIGRKKLFAWLRDNGYLIKQGNSYNMPKQRYVDQGLFEIREGVIQSPSGTPRLTYTTRITGKGQQYFMNLFLKG